MSTEQQKLARKIAGTDPLDPDEYIPANGANLVEAGHSGTNITMSQHLAIAVNRYLGVSKQDDARGETASVLKRRAILQSGNNYTVIATLATALIAQGIAT